MSISIARFKSLVPFWTHVVVTVSTVVWIIRSVGILLVVLTIVVIVALILGAAVALHALTGGEAVANVAVFVNRVDAIIPPVGFDSLIGVPGPGTGSHRISISSRDVGITSV
uniref:Uncharacterized protein n=1 Tax=Cacopsylla melanoneura TaxID=428564 RepID=A0A8D8QM60_9HEMI